MEVELADVGYCFEEGRLGGGEEGLVVGLGSRVVAVGFVVGLLGVWPAVGVLGFCDPIGEFVLHEGHASLADS